MILAQPSMQKALLQWTLIDYKVYTVICDKIGESSTTYGTINVIKDDNEE